MDYTEKMKDIQNKMGNVPFGNSQFQIAHFVANQETPERAYRTILLQLDTKYKAMMESSFRRREIEIDIEDYTLQHISAMTDIERARLDVKLERARYNLDAEIKLIEDCAIEIKTYEALLEKLPEFTHEEFERAELAYWEQKLLSDAGREILTTGTISSGVQHALAQIGHPVVRGAEGQLMYLGEFAPETVKKLNLTQNNKSNLKIIKNDSGE